MSLLTHDELIVLVEEGVIQNCDPSQVNAASIDITLGDVVWWEDRPRRDCEIVDLKEKATPMMDKIDMRHTGYFDLHPGVFILAGTREVFHLPNNLAAEYKLKSSLARAGLNAALAMWADPGWHGSVLTLELMNVLRLHTLRLRPGMRIGQMIFHRGAPVPDHASYATKGQYNHDTSATPSKGVRS